MPWLIFGVPIRKTCLHHEQTIVGSSVGPQIARALMIVRNFLVGADRADGRTNGAAANDNPITSSDDSAD